MFFTNAKECAQYPGYYHVPGNDQVVASTDGKFINLRTGNPIKAGPIYDGYWKISICFKGKTSNWYVHRLLARTFVGKPLRHHDKDYSELEVNHMNGDKSDNRLCNLEWVTSSENSKHALNQYLTTYTSVAAKNINNGCIIKFPTTLACAEQFLINEKRLRRHLKSKDAGTKTKNWFVFKFDDESPWPVLDEKDYQKDSWDIRFGIWYAKNTETGKVYFHNTLDELCEIINVNYTSAQRHARKDGREVVFSNYAIWFDDSPIKDVIDQLPSNDKRLPEGIREPKKVKVIKDGTETIYDSLVKASKGTGIPMGTITYNVEKKNGEVKGVLFSYV